MCVEHIAGILSALKQNSGSPLCLTGRPLAAHN